MRSIIKLIGIAEPSFVAIRPRRNITRSSCGCVGFVGSMLGEPGIPVRPGCVEVGGAGVGAGAGGFCAAASGARNVIAIATKTRMRMPQLMDGYLVRSLKIVGRLSVQV